MRFSRRGFLTGLAVTGAAIPVAYYTQKELLRQDVRRKEEQEITPGEAKLEVALDPGVRLADHLRGIWDIEFLDANGPQSLPRKGCELLLDAGPTGRGLRGLLGRAQSLRGDGPVEFMVQGDLASVDAARLRWRLFAGGRIAGAPSYECQVVLDEVWASWGNAGSGTLSGSLQSLQASPLAPVSAARFVARKRVFPAARDQSGLSPALLAWLVSPQHRLFHQLWHASRDRWHTLPKDKRNSLRGLGWQPGPVKHERDARGRRKHRNASGIDFLFMHRHMLLHARSLQPDLVSWQQLPQPCARLEQDRQAFIRYYENHDGCSVPPAWVADDDEEFTQWLHGLKSDAAFYGNFQVWESQYQDPEYLSRLTLGQFGSEVELGLHDWLHMRWADVARDPSNGMPVMEARLSSDFAGRWYQPQNDFLGDPFSSHVHPMFWKFHGWIDDRIDDWFRAHERYHPGEVLRREVNGVPWFAPGRWVEIDDPWLGASTHGCGPLGNAPGEMSLEMDQEVMKLALRIALSRDEEVPDLLKRAPRRPWYAQHLKL
ncbi:twin-arginine translocation signal domain-containing protein [Pseudomonas protegens]|uniref:Chromophore maturation protein PvdP n=2 Tax=Pseudomonas protegens TaxID=380021 RepID=Q4K9A0_PSEF5|nr:twin-arginine translocation signal domain-containing protein [Pseudomonas protegens]AAY93347.2 chromophore maturation protein PvdP [Pseudomonas protegens Pf-5]ASE22479.1 PvdJ/PvdD/PvdP-like protein [Pseudomonas protegens]QEZ53841.1 twin-arginine translocation signal domain-containing protein [Pseudomonas protegens]QEZ59955.1 twin-arginine translocation signal domain-containing protein [Pseudomonas protegens]QEZ65125.1 twin-arginine translocation signal domain-containing protein [Pseudomonas